MIDLFCSLIFNNIHHNQYLFIVEIFGLPNLLSQRGPMLHTANMSPQSVTVTCGHISLVFECSESIALSPALFTPTHSGHFFMNSNTGSKSDFIFMLNQNIYINLRCISSLSDDAITNRYPRKLEIFVCLMAAHMCLATFIFHFIAKILHHSFPCSNHMHDHRVGHCNCIWL